jgi:nucleoid DNA-binding protein
MLKKRLSKEYDEKFLAKLIYDYFQLVVEEVASGKRVRLKHLGEFVVKKSKLTKISNKRYRVNYKATKELWKKDKIAKEKHIMVKYSPAYNYEYRLSIFWVKYINRLKNKYYYRFYPTVSFFKTIHINAIDNINKYEDNIKGTL